MSAVETPNQPLAGNHAIIDPEYLWLCTQEPATAEMVESALDHGDHVVVRRAADLSGLANHLERDPLCLVLVDVDPSPMEMLAHLEPLVGRFEHTRFVVLSQSFEPSLVLEAMQIGARQFVVKHAIGHELSRVVKRLMPSGAARDLTVGHTLTVMSAGGGCGATTLAVNLANELGRLSHQPVLLVDLDVYYGTIAQCLGLQGAYDVGDILGHEGRIDPQLIRSTALSFTDHLHALLSPASTTIDRSAAVNFTRLASAVQAWNQAYLWTVVDAPRLPIEVAAQLAALSRCTLVVGQLLVKDLLVARGLRDALIARGVPAGSVRAVASRYAKHKPLVEVSDAELALGTSLQLLSNDFPSASAAINIGRPLADTAPHSALRRDIEHLAQHLAEELVPKKPAPTPAPG
jgi:pilus assembly protein CpaE